MGRLAVSILGNVRQMPTRNETVFIGLDMFGLFVFKKAGVQFLDS